MTETWLPFCIPEIGPPSKRGYDGIPTRTLAEIEGEVKHSMEGTVGGAVGRLMTPLTSDPYTQASWHFSIPKIGPPRQHYALEAICWHAGLPGDRRFDTSLVGNLTLIGEEHEDYPDNKLNANQIHWTIEISKAIRRLCPRVAAKPAALRVNLWEHNWLSPTSCPSGLIPWPTILAALKEDDAMTPQEKAEFADLKAVVAKIPRLVRFTITGDNHQYLLLGSIAIHIKNPAMLTSMGLGNQPLQTVSATHEWARLPRFGF